MTFYPLLFLAILNFSVLANPVPPTPRDLDIYTELLPVEEPIALNDINDSEYAGCSPDTSTKKVSDNEAIDSNQNLNILRRLVPQVCPTGFLEKNPNGAKPPRTNKNPTPKPVDRSTQSGTTEQRCDDPEEPQLVSCGGKEMRDASNGDIWYVANCVPRVAAEIPARHPMKRVKDPNIAQYCCAAYDGRSPLWAAVSCTKITPLVRIDFFLRDEPLLHLEDFLK